MQKLKNIEFLRVVGCLAIVWLHYTNRAGFGMFGKLEDTFRNLMNMSGSSNKAVDLFFMISGIFLVLTSDFSGDVMDFIKKKLIRFYPVALFAMFCFWVASFFTNIKFTYFENFLTLCNITGTPFSLKYGNLGVYWYVSIFLWISLFIYYCRKNFSKKSVDLCVALLTFFSFAFIIQTSKGSIGGNYQPRGYIFNLALLRGIGSMGIGYLIGEWYKNNAEKIRSITLPIYFKLLLTIAEGGLICFVVYFMMFHKPSFNNHMVFIACFAIILVCFLLKQGYISKLLDRDIWGKLSKFTFSIYLTHIFIRGILLYIIRKNSMIRSFMLEHCWITLLGSITIALIFGCLVFYLIEQPSARYLKRFITAKNGNSNKTTP